MTICQLSTIFTDNCRRFDAKQNSKTEKLLVTKVTTLSYYICNGLLSEK